MTFQPAERLRLMPAQPNLALKALIASRGSVRRVAEAVGMNRRTLESWVGGYRKPHPLFLVMVCLRIEALKKLPPAPRGRAAHKETGDE